MTHDLPERTSELYEESSLTDGWPGPAAQVMIGVGISLALLMTLSVLALSDGWQRTRNPRWIAPGISLHTSQFDPMEWRLPSHSLDGIVREVR